MNELIDKLENEMGLPFYFLERPEEQVNIICYRYTKEFVISDITKESSLYTFKFSLIVDKDINKKIAENEEFVRYTFFELKVRHNLSEDEIDEVLRLARNKFENLGYRVYFTGAKYNYQGENRIVESNEYLVAIKGL